MSNSCLLGLSFDVDICFATGHSLAIEFAPGVVIALSFVMATFWLLRKFRPRVRVMSGFIACLVLMVPLTVTTGFLFARYTEPKITGMITSLPMNHYVLIREKSGRPVVVYSGDDKEMEPLLVGDKITVTMVDPPARGDTAQSWWPKHSSLGGDGYTDQGNLPSRLRDLPGSTPLITPLSLKVLSKSTAPQPTRWFPVASFTFDSPITLRETGELLMPRPFQ